MKRVILMTFSVVALVVLAVPAAAKEKAPVGTRINILGQTPTTFAADTPFHIRHGWLLNSDLPAVGKFGFALEVDGSLREEDFIERTVIDPGPPEIFTKLWVHNFPGGLPAGTHTFIGNWFGPCQPLVDAGFATGPCATPNAVVEAEMLPDVLTVTFS